MSDFAGLSRREPLLAFCMTIWLLAVPLAEPPLCVDRDELLDTQAGAYSRHQLVGVVRDADRVPIRSRASARIGLALGRGGEIVDQQLNWLLSGSR